MVPETDTKHRRLRQKVVEYAIKAVKRKESEENVTKLEIENNLTV